MCLLAWTHNSRVCTSSLGGTIPCSHETRQGLEFVAEASIKPCPSVCLVSHSRPYQRSLITKCRDTSTLQSMLCTETACEPHRPGPHENPDLSPGSKTLNSDVLDTRMAHAHVARLLTLPVPTRHPTNIRRSLLCVMDGHRATRTQS